MLPPLAFERARTRADWFHYNHGKETPEYNDSGELEVDAVAHSAWQSLDGGVGLFFANASGEPQRVRVRLEAAAAGGALAGAARWSARLFAAGGEEAAPALARAEDGAAEFELPARSVAMLELS
jgi:hypothetical protein